MIPDRVRPLAEATQELTKRFSAAGKSLYLVGGIVRDAICNRVGPDADYDLTTNALPDEIEALVSNCADAVWTQGKRFGTIGFTRADKIFEVTTHRAEAYSPESRNPQVVFSDAIEADLSRRDFTINAMALRLPDLELIDPFNGIDDLAALRLRTPLSPSESFSDDPLRMLRAARFIAGFHMLPDPDLVIAVKDLHSRLSIVSAERIRDELDKLIVVLEPGPGLWFAVETGLAEEFLPELPSLALEQDPIHRHKDVLAHTIAVVEKASPDRLLRLACLFHDIGKPGTRQIGSHGVSFHHHEIVGARMTRRRMQELRYSAEDVLVVTQLVSLHLRFHGYGDDLWTDAAVRRYVRDAGDQLDRLNELTRCDCTTRNKARAQALHERMDALEQRITELRKQEELDAIRADLDGGEIMQHLAIKPGRAVGEALSFLLEQRMEEGPLGREEALRRLDAWWAAKNAVKG